MPTAPTYPGVYIEEVSSGVRTITGVATSIAAFIDFFREGPMNKAVQIFGMADFEREFGGLDLRSEASYAIAQFFLNGGSEAWVIRTAHDGGGANAVAKATVTIKKGTTGAAGEVMLVSALSEGLWGNTLRVTIGPSALAPDRFDFTVVRYASPDPKAAAIKSEKYLGLSVTTTSSKYFVDVINDESKLVRVQDLRSTASIAAGDLPVPNGAFSKANIALTAAQITALNGKKIRVKIGAATPVDARSPTPRAPPSTICASCGDLSKTPFAAPRPTTRPTPAQRSSSWGADSSSNPVAATRIFPRTWSTSAMPVPTQRPMTFSSQARAGLTTCRSTGLGPTPPIPPLARTSKG